MSAGYLGSKGEKFGSQLENQKVETSKNINILQTNLKHKNYDKNVLELINNVLKDLNQIDNIRIQVFELKIPAKDAKGIVIAAGATAYTDFGKKNFLKKGDEIFVYVYNAHAHSFQDIMNDMCGMDTYLGQCSKLHQVVK